MSKRIHRRPAVALALALLLALCTLGVPPHSPLSGAVAQEAIVLRIATLAPRGSPGERGFRRWDQLLRARTGGRLGVRVYYGGAAGDEALVIRKIRAGQLDGATMTTTGLGLVVRPVLVLQAPGLLTSYAKLDAARTALGPELEQEFQRAGFVLLGWGDSGRIRVFSKQPIRRPADLRRARPWVWPDNPVMVEFMRVVGASGVQAGLLEVLPALQTNRLDTVTSSALGVVALQWAARLRYVTSESSSIVVGAMVVSKPRTDALPADLQQALRATAAEMSGPLTTDVRRMDDQAQAALVSHGMTVVDTRPFAAEWEAAQRETRNRLAGRLYTRELLGRAERAAAGAPAR